MLKKIIYIILLVAPILVLGQTTTENYVKKTTYLQPTQDGPVANKDDKVDNSELKKAKDRLQFLQKKCKRWMMIYILQ